MPLFCVENIYACIYYFSMKALILSLSLLHIVTCTVYNVIPDDHNTTCNHCHTLQYYQVNITKYFTSNTQLLFLPGLHHLYTDLIIQDIHNISLIGRTANDIHTGTVIQCSASINIIMTNITNLTIMNLMIKQVESTKEINILHYLVMISKCKNFVVDHLKIHAKLSLITLNALGKSYLSHLSCGNIALQFDENKLEKDHSYLLIDHYQIPSHMVYDQKEYVIIFMQQISYKATLQLSYTTVADINNPFISIEQMSNASEILISNCQFQFNHHALLYIVKGLLTEYGFNGIVYLSNCHFFNNTSHDLIKLHGSTVYISQCIFYNSHELSIYRDDVTMKITRMIITNTAFIYVNSSIVSYIHLWDTDLTFTGTVTFTNINQTGTIISLKGFSKITINGLVKFTNNNVHNLISLENNGYQFMILKGFAAIEITQNIVCAFFATEKLEPIPYPFCFFQYISNDENQESSKHRNFSVAFHYNEYTFETRYRYCTTNIPIANCKWIEFTFNAIVPLDVNKRFIQYHDNYNSSIETLSINQSTLCICSDEMNYDCHISDLGYLYPGQTLFILLHSTAWHKYYDTEVIVKTDINLPYVKLCTVLDISEYQQSISKHKPCSKIQYTLAFVSTHKWCKIHLQTLSILNINEVNTFTIRKLECPPGFAEIHKNLICQCDSAITNFIRISCNINDQTILRPANSWISTTTTTTHNNSYTYQISLHCPFHYCLPYSSHLNFSTPNSQCQFNRSGLLCGQCQQGLSSVFGSPYCQQCSNIYILLIIPIAIAGLLLVFLIFYLNLTVTDGNINAFILYTNIISINIPVFFPTTNEIMPAYTFISLANLDLGIQMCFYNGMDDYAKMWLQLSFPFYLMIIAALIIILSRHYTAIQRLTARRALPVLATLFLLSYTKILQTISNVLFFYTSITYLPSKHTALVWSVDANVALFGVKFTVLFIVCLVLFLILLL